jgi:tRNA A-37 threonylcarbamoyl transferase component Bud32
VNIDPSWNSRNDDGASSEETLFHAARLLSQPKERAAFLELACADEPELRERVEQLFAARALADAFFDASPVRNVASPTAIPAIPDHAPEATQVTTGHDLPSRIGRYKLLQKIGEGGCGVVYMAEQEEPVRRLVALKVIKLGMDTRSVINRFEAERQALAMMDHPNIAKVLDAGATEAGRPYFVMELVRGVKITEYCDQARLNTRDRLELFIKVCQAIQHAHQKAVIHRDIKPSNVLVTLHDGVPVPKVIDFGIAKATQGKLTDHTLFTAFEQFIGTPAYMSPEQAEMSGLGIGYAGEVERKVTVAITANQITVFIAAVNTTAASTC